MHISVLLWGLMGLDDSNASSQGGPAVFQSVQTAHCMTFSINISTVLNRSFYSTWSGRRDVTGYCVVNLASGIQIKWSEEEEEEEGNWLFVCIRQQEAFIMTQFISNGTSQRSIGFIFMN